MGVAREEVTAREHHRRTASDLRATIKEMEGRVWSLTKISIYKLASERVRVCVRVSVRVSVRVCVCTHSSNTVGRKEAEGGGYVVQDQLVVQNLIISEPTSRCNDAEASYCPQNCIPSWCEHSKTAGEQALFKIVLQFFSMHLLYVCPKVI